MREATTGAVAWTRELDERTFQAGFARDGFRLQTASHDGVWVRSAASGELIGRLDVPDLRSECFDSDARRLWTGGADGEVRLWDVGSQTVLSGILVTTAPVITIDLSPDGTRLALNGKHDTLVWNLASGELEKRLPLPPDASDSNCTTVRFSPDGSLLAVANELSVQLFEVPSWSPRPVRRGHTQRIYSLAFSPDGATLGSGSLDHTVRLWSVATGEPLGLRLGHAHLIESLGFFDGGMRVVSGDADGVVKVFDATSWSDGPTIDMGRESWAQVTSISFGRDSQHVLCSGVRRSIWDLDARTFLLDVQGSREGELFATALSPDGRCFASSHTGGDVSVSDASSGAERWRMSGHRSDVCSLDYSRDGSRLASASDDGTIRVWEAATGRTLLVIQAHAARVRWICFSPDGTRLASASYDSTAKVWDARDGSLISTFHGHQGEVYSVSFNADGTRVASASADQTVQIWEAATGRSLKALSGTHAIMWCVAFSPDGTRLATGSQEGLVRLWDASTGQALLELRGHTRSVMSLAWSPDGRRLLSGSYAGVVRIWDAPPLHAQ
jgi:WD40 repeat protein